MILRIFRDWEIYHPRNTPLRYSPNNSQHLKDFYGWTRVAHLSWSFFPSSLGRRIFASQERQCDNYNVRALAHTHKFISTLACPMRIEFEASTFLCFSPRESGFHLHLISPPGKGPLRLRGRAPAGGDAAAGGHRACGLGHTNIPILPLQGKKISHGTTTHPAVGLPSPPPPREGLWCPPPHKRHCRKSKEDPSLVRN